MFDEQTIISRSLRDPAWLDDQTNTNFEAVVVVVDDLDR